MKNNRLPFEHSSPFVSALVTHSVDKTDQRKSDPKLSGPVLHQYTIELRKLIAKHRSEVRGRNGIAEQSFLAPSRIEEIVAGSMPTLAEHKGLARMFPALKHYHNVLVLWQKQSEVKTIVVDEDFSRPKNEEQTIDRAYSRKLGPMTATHPFMSGPARLVEIDASLSSPPEPIMPSLPPRPSISPRTFGEWLRACREGEKLDQADVASMVGVSRSAVCHWEDDGAIPVKENHDKLLTIFDRLKDAPKPKVRDIAMPKGNRAEREPTQPTSDPSPPVSASANAPAAVPPQVAAAVPPEPATAPERPSLVSPQKALIKFGVELNKLRSLDLATRKRIVDVVALGSSAGVSLEEVLAMLLEEES